MSDPVQPSPNRLQRWIVSLILVVLMAFSGAHYLSLYLANRIEPNPILPTARWLVGDPPMQNILTLEVADTYERYRRGLMARDSVGPHDGMAFPLPGEKPASFWMRGTKIPLDIAFVDTAGRVERVVTGKPMDETPLLASLPTSLVIEVPAGRAKFYGLKPGALVVKEGRVQ